MDEKIAMYNNLSKVCGGNKCSICPFLAGSFNNKNICLNSSNIVVVVVIKVNLD